MVDENGYCLPYTWFMAVYMQLSIFLPIWMYLYSHYKKQIKICHVIIIVVALLNRYLLVNQIFSDMYLNNLPTQGLTNPARNIQIFS